MKNTERNAKNLNSGLTKKEKREFDRIKESLKAVNSYEEQKEYLKGKIFINSFHTIEFKVLTF